MSYSKHFSFSLVTITVSDSLFNSQNISSWSSSFNFNAMFFTKVGIICLHLWRASVLYDILSRWLIDQSKCHVAKLHYWAKRQRPAKNWDSKNLLNWWITLVLAIWQILNIKCVQWPEKEIMRIFWNMLGKIREIITSEHILW